MPNRLFLIIQFVIAPLVALFLVLQNDVLVSGSSMSLTTFAATSVGLFIVSAGPHLAFHGKLTGAAISSAGSLAVALGSALGGLLVVTVDLGLGGTISSERVTAVVLLGAVVTLSTGLNTLFFGMFRQLEEKREFGHPRSSYDLTQVRKFARVFGLPNIFVVPSWILLAVSSQLSLAASIVILQLGVGALALVLHRYSVS